MHKARTAMRERRARQMNQLQLRHRVLLLLHQLRLHPPLPHRDQLLLLLQDLLPLLPKRCPPKDLETGASREVRNP
jgi:hypothetical protein